MPQRTISAAALKGMLAQQTDEIYLELVAISHPSLVGTIYIANNNEDVTSGGHDYVAWPFGMKLPDDDGNELPQITFTTDMVDQSIGRQVQALRYPMPKITYKVVLASSPNTVEAGPFSFDAVSVQYDAVTLQGNLGYEDEYLNEPFPGTQCTPNNNPGQFQ